MRFRWNNDWMALLSSSERIGVARKMMCEVASSSLSEHNKNHTLAEIRLLYRGYKCPNPLEEGTYILDVKPTASDKEFPIMLHNRHKYPRCPRSVPWGFVAPHEDQALINHSQTLERLAERSGLDPLELLCVLDGKHWSELGLGSKRATRSQLEAAIDQIVRKLDAWNSAGITFSLGDTQTFHSGMKTFHS